MDTRTRGLIVTPLLVAVVVGAITALGQLLMTLLDLPARLGLPSGVRVAGVGLLAVGSFFMGWLLRYRSVADILVSTYVTVVHAARRDFPGAAAAREEPLVLEGPQRHVRHPLYFAVEVLLVGWWLLVDRTLVLLVAGLLWLWFTQVVIRFEERELRALFGEVYTAYARAVPRIVPALRPRWP